MDATHYPVTMATMTRNQERIELQQLSDRFANYIGHVRSLAERNRYHSSTDYMTLVKTLEVDVTNLKNLYEHELEKLR